MNIQPRFGVDSVVTPKMCVERQPVKKEEEDKPAKLLGKQLQQAALRHPQQHHGNKANNPSPKSSRIFPSSFMPRTPVVKRDVDPRLPNRRRLLAAPVWQVTGDLWRVTCA